MKRFLLEALNHALRRCNLRLDTMTAARREAARLADAARRNAFVTPCYLLPGAFESSAHEKILAALSAHRQRFDSFRRTADNPVGYSYDNGFFSSPDAEVLYAVMHKLRPRQVIEIGCGHSTKLFRQAIRDGDFECTLVCIDPEPRADVRQLADELVREPIESLEAAQLAAQLGAGDVLSIDSSHEVKPANDVAFIYGALLPRLPPGVIVHIHDVFLPYEYPESWVRRDGLNWGEQMIVQAMLCTGSQWGVLWAGHYLQRTLARFATHFPHLEGRRAQSLWLEKRA